jgi:hypothetical protein
MNIKKYFINLLDKYQPKPKPEPIVEDVKQPVSGEPSCFVKGLLKMLTETPKAWEFNYSEGIGELVSKIDDVKVSMVKGTYNRRMWVFVGACSMDVTKEEQELLHVAFDTWRENEAALSRAARLKVVSPAIEKISQIGCGK